MKAHVLSILLLASVTLVSFNSPDSQTDPPAKTDKQAAQKAFLKTQLAHLHQLDPIDIRQVPAIYPLAETEVVFIGSPFGMRNHPVHRILKMHKGQDFAAPTGTPVIATADGIVTKAVAASDNSGYGRYIVIEHEEVFQNEEYATLYGHLSRVVVKPGAHVTRGDTIGFSGNTGTSTNPHLHYEVIRNGEHVNPVDYLM